MKKYRFFIFCIPLLILSCSKNDDDQQNSEQPDIPESITYDLNGDTVDDFTIVYSEGIWDGAGASGGVYTANFHPKEENRILSEYEENVSTSFLFSTIGDSIQRMPKPLQEWYHIGWFHTLWQDGNGVWSKEWLIDYTMSISNPYYVGVQIKEGDEFLIGWLKLEIDKTTGKIDIVDHKLTSEDFIVIDE